MSRNNSGKKCHLYAYTLLFLLSLISFICDVTFRFVFDAMHAVTGAYAKPIFVEKLGASLVCFHL